MTPRRDVVWQDPLVVERFVKLTRSAIPNAEDQLDAMLRYLTGGGRPVRRILDVGCGTGVTALAVVARHPGAEVVLVDFSQAMLDGARQVFSELRPTPHYIEGDLADCGWQAGVVPFAPFDVVVSSFAIHHLPDVRKRALYAEIYDLLAPGGSFVNLDHVASATPALEAIFEDLMIDRLTAAEGAASASARPRETVAVEYRGRPDKAANILAPVELQCEWLRGSGFRDVDCFFKVFELAVFGGRRAPTGPCAET